MLKTILSDYENLLNKHFKLVMDDSQILEFEFKDVNFMHLIGLHKLDDISIIQKFNDKNDKIHNAKKIYADISNGVITYDELAKSKKIKDILESRLNYFSSDTIIKLIHKEEVIHFNPSIVSLRNSKATKLEKIDYIFFETIEVDGEGYLQFCLAFENRSTKNYPTTFFLEKSDLYVSGQKCKNIVVLNIESTKCNEFKIYWDKVRLSMKKNSHFKWLEKKAAIYGYTVEELNQGNVNEIDIGENDLIEVKKHLDLLRIDEVKMVYLPFIPEASTWNNEQKRYIANYIDSSENKNVTPSQVKKKLSEYNKINIASYIN